MILRLSCTSLLLTTTLALGCRGDDPAGSTETETSTGGSTGGSTSSTTEQPTTSGVDSTSTTDEPTTTNNSQGFITTQTAGSTGPSGPQPLGGMCMTDDECESMNCYQNPLMPGQGVCSECNEDADCTDAMTGISCSFGIDGYATCEDGSLGDQCMSQDGCMDGLFCDAVIEIPIPGIIPNTCGECSDSGDCMNGQICSPEVDFMSVSGSKKCVDPGSVPNDSFCPHSAPDGDMACMSGICSTATVMGLVTIGLCGECETDADCMGGTCMPAEASMNGVAGSKCV